MIARRGDAQPKEFRCVSTMTTISTTRPGFDLHSSELGDVRGLNVLDYGCGHGMAAVVLARSGTQVTAFDLSGGYVEEAKARAAANGVNIDFVQADGEHLAIFRCVI